MSDPELEKTYRVLSDALGLHRECPAAACRRAKRCMRAQVDGRLRKRVPRDLRRLTDDGMMPCKARFAHGLQTGDPVMRGVMDGLRAYVDHLEGDVRNG